jgi:hypothetical protein
MVRVDTLLLAKYGIFQPVRREGPMVMTIIQPLNSLSNEDRLDLMEFAEMVVALHEGDADDAVEADDDRRDDDDEGVLHDEA